MPPRPAVKGKNSRPVSAIYIGSANKQTSSSASVVQTQAPTSSSSPHSTNGPTGDLTDVPDLPEPPSPNSSVGSRNSGLPSPPATNSTGSGSTGDPGSVARRQRPLSFASDSSASTSGSSHRTMSNTLRRGITSDSSSRSSSRLADVNDFNNDDDDHDNDPDGDDTARLDRLHHAKSSSENARALQRVMSLTQRNRMAIDKLTRLGSPSPTPRSRSPSHSSSTSSSRLRQVRTASQPANRDQGLSGSETERESTSTHTFSSHSHSSSSRASTSQRPITPPANIVLSGTSSTYSRFRNLSAPDSPNKARLLNAVSAASNSSGSPTTRRRKHASMATMTSITQNYEDEDELNNENPFDAANGSGRDRLRDDRDTVRDITQSALAAVASSRRSPIGTRRRGALPREFREDIASANNTDGTSVASDAHTRRNDEFARVNKLSDEPITPYRNNGRSSTVREARRSGGPSRWGSDDYRNIGSPEASPTEASKRERRQTLRGGSAESALGLRSPGRTLLGEGLRAAGLTKREVSSPTAIAPGDTSREKRSDWSPGDPEGRAKRRAVTYSRAATSMANFRYQDNPEDHIERERGLRNHRSTYSLAEERDLTLLRKNRDISLTRTERNQLGLDNNLPALKSPLPHSTLLPLAKATPQHLQERYQTASPVGTKRPSVVTPAPGSGEHSHLMVESLSVFESIVSKLPAALGPPSLGSVPSNTELLKHAQILVNAADRVNALMRQGTSRALEKQINAEVEEDDSASGRDMLCVWRQVGGEYREGLRASDELVRSITSFLMDTGSVLRKLATTPAMSEFGSPAIHARSVSLDEEGVRQQQRLMDNTEESSGRQSVQSRRSWEPTLREREREREETLRKLGGGGNGRGSSLALARASPAFLSIRERDKSVFQTPSPLSGTRPLPAASNTSSAGRLFDQTRSGDTSSSQNRNTAIQPSDSKRTLQGNLVEPSPTPVSRTTIGRDRNRELPPGLPPAKLSEQPKRSPPANFTAIPTNTGSVRNRMADRRKPSVASIATIRATGPSFPSLTTPSLTTTGISHHTVSSSPQESWFPRSNSDKSVKSTVTFSHPSSVSVSAALSGIQQQVIDDDRRRTDQVQQQSRTSSFNASKTAVKLNPPGMAKARSEDPKHRTMSARTMRMSLDGASIAAAAENSSMDKNSNAHAADRSAVSTLLPNGRNERRRTVTDIWPRRE